MGSSIKLSVVLGAGSTSMYLLPPWGFVGERSRRGSCVFRKRQAHREHGLQSGDRLFGFIINAIRPPMLSIAQLWLSRCISPQSRSNTKVAFTSPSKPSMFPTKPSTGIVHLIPITNVTAIGGSSYTRDISYRVGQ